MNFVAAGNKMNTYEEDTIQIQKDTILQLKTELENARAVKLFWKEKFDRSEDENEKKSIVIKILKLNIKNLFTLSENEKV